MRSARDPNGQAPTSDADLRLTSLLLNGVYDTGDAWQAGAGCRFFMGPCAAFRLQVTRMREMTFDVNKDHLHSGHAPNPISCCG